MEIQPLRPVRKQAIRREGRVGSLLEGAHRRLVDGDVIRVAVAADGIEGQHHLRTKLTNIIGNFRSHLVQRLGGKSMGMVVIWRARHTRITVIQEVDAFQSEMNRRAAQLGLAQVGDRGMAFQVIHLAHLAARRANQVHVRAARGVESQRAAHAEGFVIGVSQNSQ